MTHDVRRITAEQVRIPPGSGLNSLPWIAGLVGLAGIGASALLGRERPEQFYHSWLVAYLYFLSIALGGLFFVLTHYLTGARWSVVVRRLAENVMGALPVFAVLFVPVWLGLHNLYPWTHEDMTVPGAMIQFKAWWLRVGRFELCAVIYLVTWAALAIWFLRTSREQDESGDPALTRRMIAVSAPALIVFAVTVSLAGIDWIMTLDPHWYSTMFGVYFFAGALVGIFATLCIMSVTLTRAGILAEFLTLEHLHDLGKLLFAFCVFWAYIAFSQFFLIWYGNIPEETVFFMQRSRGSWSAVTRLLVVGHFVVPFLFLMSRQVKRRPALLTLGSIWLLAMHYVDLYWLIMPELHDVGVDPSLLDLTTFVGVGGIFLGAVGWAMRGGALLPLRDPRLAESLGFENS